MTRKQFFRTRLYFTGFATFAIVSLLTWNHLNGGVPSHHVLSDETLPLISNWWGLLVIPLLTCFLTYRIQMRIFSPGNREPMKQVKKAIYGLIGALLFGSLLAVFFSIGNMDMPGNMLFGLLPLALFIPIFRAEYLLGFVFGMTYTFGAVLPTGIGAILTLITAGIYLLIRPGLIYVGSKLTQKLPAIKK